MDSLGNLVLHGFFGAVGGMLMMTGVACSCVLVVIYGLEVWDKLGGRELCVFQRNRPVSPVEAVHLIQLMPSTWEASCERRWSRAQAFWCGSIVPSLVES